MIKFNKYNPNRDEQYFKMFIRCQVCSDIDNLVLRMFIKPYYNTYFIYDKDEMIGLIDYENLENHLLINLIYIDKLKRKQNEQRRNI